MNKVRLHEQFVTTILPQLHKQLNVKNVMEVPHLEKIVINVGVKEAVGDSKALQHVMDAITKIAGQKPVKTLARKSIAGFKIREDMPLGVMVTLRRQRMYEFLDRLINLALPRVRDFQGVSTKLDGRGNYNLGVKEYSIFPEVDFGVTEKVHGMNITIHTSAQTDEHGYELLKAFGMPFKRAK